MKPVHLTYLALLPLALACHKSPDDPIPGMHAVTYQATDAVIANPERGLSSPVEISGVTAGGIPPESFQANRESGRTLFLLTFNLKDYVDTDISEDGLEAIRTRFQSLRDGGAKCILRFCYSDGSDEKDKPWDATPKQTLRHIGQLTPLIQEYYDVILTVQAGFIGSRGEWLHTENYEDDASRKVILDALLEAVPEDRQVEVRTPAIKMNLYGFTLADTITRATAHQPNARGRLGGHIDGYLAGSDDPDTYRGGNDRAYWAAESAYTILGGETRPDSEKARDVLADMARNHFTYLNIPPNSDITSRWKAEGFFDDIQRGLGYRFVLDKGQFTKKLKAGKELRVVLNLHNEGFAPVQNPREVELVLTDKAGKHIRAWHVSADPRYWMPGRAVVIDQTVTIPADTSGEVTLWLNLPDPCETLRNNPLFSIRLANDGVWDEEKGYNALYSFTL